MYKVIILELSVSLTKVLVIRISIYKDAVCFHGLCNIKFMHRFFFLVTSYCGMFFNTLLHSSEYLRLFQDSNHCFFRNMLLAGVSTSL